MNLFPALESALASSSIAEKRRLVEDAITYCSTADSVVADDFAPKTFANPSYASFCRIVPPEELPKRRRLDTDEGLAVALHAVVHIEYSAIDLALDAVYRFPRMPREYRLDWLEVAREEIDHFEMLAQILADLGYRYGDFPVHSGLFDAARHTAGDVLDRMAVIPRHYEATGLDVNPRMSERFRRVRNDALGDRIVAALDRIYREEIDHVRKGDRWFRFECARRGFDPESKYLEILEKYGFLRGNRRVLNVQARREAGFGCEELRALGALRCD
ncbi:ferritin-like domain-containing protein [Nitratifractor sp.]